MKTNIWKWLMAILPLLAITANAQDVITIGKDTLVTRKYLREFIKGGGVIVDPGTPNCDKHPTIDAIFDITATTAKVRFDASGLTEFQLSFQSMDGKEISYQRFKDPKTNTVQITFAKQPIGSYQLELIPISCKSTKANDIKTFRLTDGGVSPPVSDCFPYSISEIKNVSNSGATVKFAAKDLTKLTLTLLSTADAPIKSITYEPKQDELYFPFNVGPNVMLPAGSYRMRITPVSCNGEPKYLDFVVKGSEQGEITPPVENNNIPKFSISPKNLLDIRVNGNGEYQDLTPGDYVVDGVRYRDVDGITYKVLYWLTESPLLGKDSSIIDFGKQKFPNGITPSIRKEYAAFKWNGGPLSGLQQPWRGALSHESFRVSGYDNWLHHGENPDAKSEYIYRTAMGNIVTNGGYDMKTGEGFVRENLPSWLDAGKLVPQYFYNPTTIRPDKPVIIQCYPQASTALETVKRLYEGGITHIWWQNLHDPGNPLAIYENGRQIVGADKYPMFPAFNASSIDYNHAFPNIINQRGIQATDEQAIEVANRQPLGNYFVITSEYSEGDFPQGTKPQNKTYGRLGDRVKEEGLVGVQILGDYGYNSKNLTFANDKLYGRQPMHPYYLSLLGPDGKDKLQVADASGHTVVKHEYYLSGQYKLRGTIVGTYYAITFMNQDRFASAIYEAILFNTMFPGQPKQRFTTGIMQSNNHGADVPYKDSGTIMADGSLNQNYPEAPAEFLKYDGLISLLLYNSAYYWDAYGKKNADNVSLWYDSSIMIDSWVFGTRLYSKMIPSLNECNREIKVADFTSGTKKFASKTPERHVSNNNQTFFGNTYFNECVDQRSGSIMYINSKKKVFIYFDQYRLPTDVKDITAHIDGKDYHLGECAGSTITVFWEK